MKAQFNLDAIVREIENFAQPLHFKDPFYSSVFESDKIQKLADLKRRELEASIAVERATTQCLAQRDRSTRRSQTQLPETAVRTLVESK